MFTILKKQVPFFVSFFLVTILFSGSIYSQQSSYMGTEAMINHSELLSKAKATDFGKSISAQIYKDSKNTYYAVDVKKLSSKYEKIRLLELSYADKVLVSMGADSDFNYYFFLVNNTMDKSPDYVYDVLNSFLSQSKEEEKTLSDEQLRLWLIQHDKYSIK